MNIVGNILLGILLLVLGGGGIYIKSLKGRNTRLSQEKDYLKALNKAQQIKTQQIIKQGQVDVTAAKTETAATAALSSLEGEMRQELDKVETVREREETKTDQKTSDVVAEDPIPPQGGLPDDFKKLAAEQVARTKQRLADGPGTKFV